MRILYKAAEEQIHQMNYKLQKQLANSRAFPTSPPHANINVTLMTENMSSLKERHQSQPIRPILHRFKSSNTIP